MRLAFRFLLLRDAVLLRRPRKGSGMLDYASPWFAKECSFFRAPHAFPFWLSHLQLREQNIGLFK